MRTMIVLVALLAFTAGATIKTEVSKQAVPDTVKTVKIDTIVKMKPDTTFKHDTTKTVVWDTLVTTKTFRDTVFTKVDTVKAAKAPAAAPKAAAPKAPAVAAPAKPEAPKKK